MMALNLERDQMTKWILLCYRDGYITHTVGPFNKAPDAEDWAKQFLTDGQTWQVIACHNPTHS
jgi:hypothetical protein